MTTAFSAAVVTAEPVDDILTVGFAEQPDGSGRYLLLQQDDGTEGNYYIEFCDQARAGYDGLESAQLLREQALFSFTTSGAQELQETHIVVSFSLSERRFAELQTSLSKILGDSLVQSS